MSATITITTMRPCGRCHVPFSPVHSAATLRLTYCSFLCERADLGFSLLAYESTISRKAAAS